MTTNTNPPGTAWMQIVMKKGTSYFAKSFTPDASLQTSALSKAVVGPTLIGAFFAATSKMYEHFVFTAETVDGAKTYLEWEGRGRNAMKFSTIISRTVFAVSLACASTFVAVAPAQAAAPMQHKEVAGFTNPPGAAWMQIVMKKGTSDFATSFTADATLQTSALSKAVVGPTLIGAFFAATSKMYEQFVFTAETVDGAKTYLEWEGIHGGKPVAGVTIITRNESGLINNIKLFQSPFPVVREFSSGLKERLEGTLGQDFFN